MQDLRIEIFKRLFWFINFIIDEDYYSVSKWDTNLIARYESKVKTNRIG